VTPRRPLLALTALLLTALAACSSGGGSGATSTTRRAARATTTTTPTSTTTTAPAVAGADWPTYDHDAARSGVAADGPSNAAAIRRQWSSPALDGDVYAQPLLVGDRVIVATENDTVYSLNAADGTVAWSAHLGSPVAGSSLPCGDVDPVGITGTPVVDASAGRVYAVGMVQPAQHMLFDLDLATGHLIGSTRVDAPGADPAVHNQRAALTLSNGRVYVPFGGRYGDCGNYHGRVVSVAVTAAGLGSTASYLLPTQRAGGFWAPPGAATASDGSLYLTSGNSTSRGTFDYGNAVVRLTPELTLADWFAPTNWVALNSGDVDLGSTGPVLLPSNRVFQVGKGGVGYLLDASHLGGVGGQLAQGSVCSSAAFGGVAVDGETMYVPCLRGVTQVVVSGDGFRTGWTATLDTPGPTVVTGNAVWTVATGSGDLVALDRTSGQVVTTQRIGSVPSRFTSLAAGGGQVVVAASRTVLAFGG
jgi:outer membrane protein assembly factor BamB